MQCFCLSRSRQRFWTPCTASVSVKLAARHAVLLLRVRRSYANMGRSVPHRQIRDVMAVGAGSASHMRWDASDAALIGASSATVCTSLFAVTRTPTEPEMQTTVTAPVDGAEIEKKRSQLLVGYYISIYNHRHWSDVSCHSCHRSDVGCHSRCHWSDVVTIG